MTVVPMRRTGAGRPRSIVLIAVAILMALGFGFGAALAQDTTTVVTHPAHIHQGSCLELDPNPAAPLANLGPRGYDVESGEFTSDDQPEARGSLSVTPVVVSESTAEIGFDTILESTHAINVHESDQNIQNYIACGDIGGQVFDDKLFISLIEQNDSGYFGIAILEPDGDNTKVTVYLGQAVEAGAAPEDDTPESEAGDDEGTPDA